MYVWSLVPQQHNKHTYLTCYMYCIITNNLMVHAPPWHTTTVRCMWTYHMCHCLVQNSLRRYVHIIVVVWCLYCLGMYACSLAPQQNSRHTYLTCYVCFIIVNNWMVLTCRPPWHQTTGMHLTWTYHMCNFLVRNSLRRYVHINVKVGCIHHGWMRVH